MGAKIAAAPTCYHWPQPSVSRPPSFSQTLASAISSPSQKRRRFMTPELYRSGSGRHPKLRFGSTRFACSASLNAFSNEEFSNMFLEPPDWPEREGIIIPASIERKANSFDLPLSLRIIKRKKQWQKGVFREAGETAYCSVKKAFSNMVFIIRELNTYIFKMREMLSSYEELHGILTRVEREIHSSFVWLFQHVFSHTPTLMVYVMILLANYSVHSMASNPSMQPYVAIESVSLVDNQEFAQQNLDSSAIKTFSVSSQIGISTTIDGINGDGGFDRQLTIGKMSEVAREEECISGQVDREEELRVWNSFVDEALDHERIAVFVSPVYAKIESDDYDNYFRTEMMYRRGLAQEPNNSLLLANYAQFLHLVAQDYDRAEEYFKRAAEVEPKDSDALNKYATFLWQVRKDLWGAEQRYQDAVAAAEPNNSFYAASYAHFLWNTGGEDTCFPLDTTDTSNDA